LYISLWWILLLRILLILLLNYFFFYSSFWFCFINPFFFLLLIGLVVSRQWWECKFPGVLSTSNGYHPSSSLSISPSISYFPLLLPSLLLPAHPTYTTVLYPPPMSTFTVYNHKPNQTKPNGRPFSSHRVIGHRL
jgi:hypothetical protein